MAIELATAYVSIVPSTRGFERKLKEDLRRAGGDIKIDVDAETGGATSNMTRWRRQEGSKSVNVKVDVDTKGATRQMVGLRRTMEDIGRSDFLRLNIGAAALSTLPALAAGLAQVASAMQQVAQASLAIPGGIAGAASSIGTLAFGVSGVKDAFDALNKAQDDAATSGGDMASTARAQMSASNSLRNAIVDEAQARKDVAEATRDARRELTDLNLEMRGGVLSEKRAILESRRAREELAKGGFKSASDVQDALLRVEEADQRVLEVRARNAETADKLAEANAKGIANNDQVVAAAERLTRAQQQVAEAQAATAVSAPKASAAQESAALAMSKLAPNARDFVDSMMDLEPSVMGLRNLVQDNIFEGLGDQLTGLARKALPTVEKGLGSISEAWNRNFTELFNVLGEDKNLTLVDRILGNTAETQSRLSEAIDPLVEGIAVLTASGTDSLPRLADAFTDVSQRFANFITAADADGRLQRWIDEGITAMGNLGGAVLNVGKMFTAITRAAGGGASLLEGLEQWTDKLQSWLNSAEGQQTLKNLFAEGKRIFEEWKPILEALPGLFQGFYEAASGYMSALLDILRPIATFFSEHPGLVEAAAQAYLVFKSAQVIGSIATLGKALAGIDNQLGVAGGKGGKGGVGILGKLSTLGTLGLLGPGLASDVKDASEFGLPSAEEFFADKGNNANKSDSTGGTPIKPTDVLGSGGAGGSSNPITGPISSNPNNANTGGALTPETASIQDYLRNGLGFKGTIGGWREPDGFNEHSSGKASDVMVQSAAEGNALLPNLLRQPGVEYILWNQKTWYPDGSSEPMEDRGDPTQNHMDHLHVKTYDQGGLWPSGTVGINTTGKDEYVLTPEDLKFLEEQGIDPNSLPKGVDPNIPGGPVQPGRTEGYIPAAAGSTAKVGNSPLAGAIGLGAEAINGVIDMAADIGKMAASGAAAAGTMGAGAAAGPAAGMGIDIAAGMAKRGVEWGADMIGIVADSVVEQAFPFGAPRWLGSADPTAFMPNLNIAPALTTTSEAAIEAIRGQSAVDPNTTQHGTGFGAAPGPQDPITPQAIEGVNALSQAAKEAANITPVQQPAMVHVENIHAADSASVGASIAKQQRLEMMRFAGRP